MASLAPRLNTKHPSPCSCPAAHKMAAAVATGRARNPMRRPDSHDDQTRRPKHTRWAALRNQIKTPAAAQTQTPQSHSGQVLSALATLRAAPTPRQRAPRMRARPPSSAAPTQSMRPTRHVPPQPPPVAPHTSKQPAPSHAADCATPVQPAYSPPPHHQLQSQN